MQQGLFGMWQTQEYQDMLEWMRAYNANPTHTTKIHFFGMDIRAISQGDFDAVENYVHTVDPQQATLVKQMYADIFSCSGCNAATRQHYQDQAQQVYDLLHAHQQAYENRSSPQAFVLALQNARIIVQFTNYAKANTQRESLTRFIQRDAFMAENVAWIHDHAAGSHPKLIVWAHDGHIANNIPWPSFYPQVAPKGTENMGGFLRKWYHDNYLTIATSLYQGAYTIYLNNYQTVTTAILGVPGKDTYNYTLGNVSIPIYLLDLRKTPPGSVTDWANGPYIFLEYGFGGENLSVSGPLQQWFDLIVLIRDTTGSHSLLR
jgi:erythromycin esterase